MDIRDNLAATIKAATKSAKKDQITIEIHLDPISNAEDEGDYGYCAVGAGKYLYRFGKYTHTITPDGKITEVSDTPKTA